MELNKNNLEKYQEELNRLEEFKQRLADKKTKFESDNKLLIGDIKNLSEDLSVNKETFKEQALQLFTDTGEKKLIGGLGVRVGIGLIYDSMDALKWAKEHDLALELNKKRFEQLAKTENIEFVEKKSKITITFPKVIKFEETKKDEGTN